MTAPESAVAALANATRRASGFDDEVEQQHFATAVMHFLNEQGYVVLPREALEVIEKADGIVLQNAYDAEYLAAAIHDLSLALDAYREATR